MSGIPANYTITPVRAAPGRIVGWFPCAKALAEGYEVDGPNLFDVFSSEGKARAAARRAAHVS